MPALTLLSVIAPTVPRAAPVSTGEAESGFRSLLEALSGEAAVAPAARNPAEAPTLEEPQVETDIDAPATAGFLALPTPPPTPLVLPAAEELAPAGADGPADRTGEAGAGTGGDPDGLQATTPLPSDKGPTSKTTRPEVQPPLPDVRPLTGDTSETQPTLAEAAAATEALKARTGATSPALSALSAAPPPPLRPLAERTSRPLDAPVARTGDGSRVADPARSGPAIVTAVPPVAFDQSVGPADPATTSAAGNIADVVETDGGTPEQAMAVETATAQTQAQAGARETGVSQLSRATIEATAQIAAQILRRLEGRSTRFEMALTPDELGRVDVKLDIDSEGRLNARLAFDNPAAATDLRGRTDELRRQLEDAGFHLAEDAFEFADRDSGSSAFDRGQDARNGPSRAFAAASRLNTEIDVAQPPRWLALSLSPSGVDMKV